MMELEKNIHEGSQSQSEKEREIMLQKSQIQEMRRINNEQKDII